jgi:hypothetical protein
MPRQQSVELDVPAKAGEGKPRRHPDWTEPEPFKTVNPNIKNLYENFLNGVGADGTADVAPTDALMRRLVGELVGRLTRQGLVGGGAGSNNCFGVRSKVNGALGPYEWQTYAEVNTRVKNVGYGRPAPLPSHYCRRLTWCAVLCLYV